MPEPETLRQEELFGPAPLPLLAGVFTLTGDQPRHAHDFLEVAVVSGGAGAHVTSSGRSPARPGDVYVLRPGAWHEFAGCADLVVANCCIGMSGLTGDLALLQGLPELRQLLWTGPAAAGRHGVLATAVGPAAAQAATEQIRALTADLGAGPHNRVLLAARLLGALGLLVGEPDPAAAAAADSRGRHPVAAAVEALSAAPERPWTVAELAALVRLDPAYLTRLFRRHVGLPPIAHLARLRAERAAVLLARTDLPVATIGAAVGWTDPNYFTRRFHALSGLPPTAYRRRSRQADRGTHPDRPPA